MCLEIYVFCWNFQRKWKHSKSCSHANSVVLYGKSSIKVCHTKVQLSCCLRLMDNAVTRACIGMSVWNNWLQNEKDEEDVDNQQHMRRVSLRRLITKTNVVRSNESPYLGFYWAIISTTVFLSWFFRKCRALWSAAETRSFGLSYLHALPKS